MAAGRSRINGVGRQQKQNKRAATSFQDKLQVIQHYEASRDMQATVLKFYPELNESERRAKARVVYRWLQLKDAIATHANSAKTKNQSRIRHVGSATTLGIDGEKQLVAWLREMRHSGEQVSTEMLRVKALAVAKERNVPEGAFAASGTWQKSFLDRNKKHLRDNADADDDGGDAGDTESDASGSAEPSSASTGGDEATRGNGGKSVINVHNGNESSKPQARVQATESATPVNQLPRTQPQQQLSEESSPQVEQQPVPAATAKPQPVELKRHELVVVAPAPVPAAAASVSTATAAPAPAVVAPTLPVVATPAVAPPPTTTAAAVAPATVPASTEATAIATAAVLPALPATAIIAPTALQLNSTPVKDSPAAEDAEDRELKKRKAEIEDRKAELLNESIRCDNVLKKIRIAEENMFARKRLRDAGIPQEEIDAMLPVQRD